MSKKEVTKQEGTEDLVRLVGNLEAAYHHAKAAYAATEDPKYAMAAAHLFELRRASSKDLKDLLNLTDEDYCLIAKHLPYGLILAGELKNMEAYNRIYGLLSELTGGQIAPCKACQEDAKG